MPQSFTGSFLWLLTLLVALVFLAFAGLSSNGLQSIGPFALQLFAENSIFVFCMFSMIFSFICLSFSLNTPIGRPLTLATMAVSGLLLAAAGFLNTYDLHGAHADYPALAAAYMMFLRVLSIGILPARGDRSGLKEAGFSLLLSILAGLVWMAISPQVAPIAATSCLLLSWPFLIDGINAFADKVFHRIAVDAGARDIQPQSFSQIARARDILIDKAAVMSGPNLMVTNVMAFNNEPKTLLAVAASAEAGSDHPVAHALRQLASQWQVDLKQPDRFEPSPGLGVVALLGGQTVVIGATELLKKLNIDSFTADAIARSLEADGKTVLRVAVGGRVVGVLGLEGTLRQDAGVAGMALRREGLVPWLYTADSSKTREALAGLLGLEPVDDPKAGETIAEGTARLFARTDPLVLTLSADRMSLELRVPTLTRDGQPELSAPLAVSDTDDIGAFPTLKALAMRRNLLAVQAKRILAGLWVVCGLLGGFTLLPIFAAPFLFLICLCVLWVFAKLSIADTLRTSSL